MPKKCNITANFNVQGKSALYCIYDGCSTRPYYNFAGEKRGIYCNKHRLVSMINVKRKTCIYDECGTCPSYNFAGEKRGIYCNKHKLDDMIDVVSKTCIYDGCSTQSSYNFAGKKMGLYCVTHKLDDMIDVVSKTCIYEGCSTKPNYNFAGEKRGIYCNKHRLVSMIDVVSKTCLECDKQPSFNNQGEKKGLYCVEHKKEGMINVIQKTCLECDKQPSFNNQGEKKGLYCVEHKKEGMINVTTKRCLECNIIPYYNVKGEKKGLYCNKHKLDDMIDVLNKTCKSDWCSTKVSTKKYDGYCLFCYINLFPDKTVSRNYKTKEYAVIEFITTKFPHFDFIADKIISGGCSRRRPDLFLDILYQIIIIEIDENQHQDYDSTCENKRVMELSQDLGHRPIVFIRFNPDDYKKDGKNITSCWGCNKNGICVVKKSKQKEWLERLNTLEDQIKYWTDPENMTDKTIEIIHLYYNVFL